GLADPALLIRAGSALEEALDLGQLALAAEPCGGAGGPLDELRDGLTGRARAVAREVDELRVEPVPDRAPLALGDPPSRLDRHRPLGQDSREALREGGDPGDALDPGLRVADAQLDGSELRMRPHV